MEYRYAVERGKPVIGFLHDNPKSIPASATEQEDKRRRKLEAFRAFVQTRLVKYWSSPADLGAKVSRSITQLFRQHPAVGWVRADKIPAQYAPETVLKLHERVKELEELLKTYERKGVEILQQLSFGKDKVALNFVCNRKREAESNGRKGWETMPPMRGDFDIAWDDIFSFLAPSLMTWATNYEIERRLKILAKSRGIKSIGKIARNERVDSFHLTVDSINKVLIQLASLQLIEISSQGGHWQLSDHGRWYLAESLAIKKPHKVRKTKQT
ncbi:MAG: hypothetical protein JWO38_6643 [Gemmataceae bacterium]|nr:hypothetical protein [Gemmataceae bacterium]